jgi:hypothetical protein
MIRILAAVALATLPLAQAQARATSAEDAAQYVLDNDELDTYCDGSTAIDRVPGYSQRASEEACELIEDGEVE